MAPLSSPSGNVPVDEARFVLHVWTEPREDEARPSVVRGSLTRVDDGEAAYFETLPALEHILASAMGRKTLFGDPPASGRAG
jgi:hypothetical protein